MGAGETGDEDGRAAESIGHERGADGVDGGVKEGEVGSRADEEVTDEHRGEAEERDDPGRQNLGQTSEPLIE